MAAKLPDIKTILSVYSNLGLNSPKCRLKDDIKRSLRIIDEQDAVRRYKWYNLPNGLTGEKIERMLYYKGNLAFFYEPLNDTFYCLPFCYSGQLDCYGEFSKIKPLTFGNSSKENKVFGYGKEYDIIKEYTIPDSEEVFNNSAVILFDYTPQLDINNITPRYILQDSILDAMAECFPLARTAMVANSGIKGMRVQNEDDADQVEIAAKAMVGAALAGQTYVPITSKIEIQDLGTSGSLNTEDFLRTMQSMNNFRKSCYGLDSGGIFEKNAHILQSEQAANTATSENPFQDGLAIRQRFCDTVNLLWGLQVWCEPSETAINADINRDGTSIDEDSDRASEENINIEGGDEE
jgi:hypothetical protein